MFWCFVLFGLVCSLDFVVLCFVILLVCGFCGLGGAIDFWFGSVLALFIDLLIVALGFSVLMVYGFCVLLVLFGVLSFGVLLL